MCREHKKEQGFAQWVIIVLFIFLLVIAVLFFCHAEIPPLRNICRMTTNIETSMKVSPVDSVEFSSYASRLDSIQSVLTDVRDQYQDDINIGIDRLNSWIGFWLTILTLVLLLAGVWQYIQVRHHDREWEKQQDEWKNEKEKIGDEFKKLQDERSLLREEYQVENTIFNLLRTMGAVHDPMMLLQADNRKQLILEYLERIQIFLLRYAKVKSKYEANVDIADEYLIYELILVNLRVTVCRSKPLFTSPSANVRMITFLDYVEKEEKNFRETKSVDEMFFQKFNKELGVLIDGLKLDSI